MRDDTESPLSGHLRRFLARLEAEDAREDMERAVGWVVVLTDLEYGRISVYGEPFDEPAAAFSYAASIEQQVNEGAGDQQGWKATVHPLLPSGLWDRPSTVKDEADGSN
jgi:hypothetical protein